MVTLFFELLLLPLGPLLLLSGEAAGDDDGVLLLFEAADFPDNLRRIRSERVDAGSLAAGGGEDDDKSR